MVFTLEIYSVQEEIFDSTDFQSLLISWGSPARTWNRDYCYTFGNREVNEKSTVYKEQ